MQLANVATSREPFVVKERLGNDMEMHGMGSNLTLDGLDLDTPSDVLADKRYMWLEFSPASNEERIRALGEITERTHAGVRVRFKHLFPDQKRRLAIMLDESAMM
jgi:hypothetical protein